MSPRTVTVLFTGAVLLALSIAGSIVRTETPVPLWFLSTVLFVAGVVAHFISILAERRGSVGSAGRILKKAAESGIDVSDVPDLIRNKKLRSVHFSRRGILLLIDRDGNGEIRFRDVRVRLKAERIVPVDPAAVEITLAGLAGVPLRDFDSAKMSDDEIKFLLFAAAIT